MRKKIILFILPAAVVIVSVAAGFISPNKKMKNISQNGFAVIELFTSEGCSSCPPADETVAGLLAKNIKNVYILAFHVDYWNRLGWKDPFSKAEYSQRQSAYASKFNLGSVYTPQVIVNGSSEFVGSDEQKLVNKVKEGLNNQVGQEVSISAKKNEDRIVVNYNIEDNSEILLNIALVQPEASIAVKRGENNGRTLHHINIVRAFKTISAKGKGSVEMDLVNNLKEINLQVIAYTQQKTSYQILGADQKPVQ